MKCPECGGKSGVLDTRRAKKYIYRRRRCYDCGKTFSTREYYASEFTEEKSKLEQIETCLRVLDRLDNRLRGWKKDEQ